MDSLFRAFDSDEKLSLSQPDLSKEGLTKKDGLEKVESQGSEDDSGGIGNDDGLAMESNRIVVEKRRASALKLEGSDAVIKKTKALKDESSASDGISLQQESLVKDQERKPAKTYPFELDGFQKESINYLERGESVLVAAHTSAGKTAVAEYAIAMALRDKQRVIYTSPIKALSNQKYRDLVEEFSDVGLMTGDVTINPNASCLVMTTEILRSMLYRGSEILREVAYAIFDEVHYMRDRDRGVVWEESIVLLPHKVRYVFLSATIPNSQEFCDWIESVHHQPCHAVYTDYRPTPLQHYVYPTGGTGVHLIVDGKGKFHDDEFEKAMSSVSSSSLEDDVGDGSALSRKARQRLAAKRRSKMDDLESIVQMIMQRNYDPAIVFSFSKNSCEKFAARMSQMDLNSPEEKELVVQVFNNAIDSLSEDDKKLPQVHSLLPLLRRGIGIHHGGLLPILKELTEILFGEGLIKVLFATETFAMGINMPAKTVVFTDIRKFDGSDFRFVSAGEYIQMSGRAGRRGLDDRGIVMLMIDEALDPVQAKEIMSGHADPLTSTFRLSYNMILNLKRVEDADPEFIIRKSLRAFQDQRSVPELEAKCVSLENRLKDWSVEKESELANYAYLLSQASKALQKLKDVYNGNSIKNFLNSGRLVMLADSWGWGVFYRMEDSNASKKSSILASVIVMGMDETKSPQLPYPELIERQANEACPVLRNFPLDKILLVSSIRINVKKAGQSGRKSTPKVDVKAASRALQEVKRRFSGSIPLLDPEKDLKIEDKDTLLHFQEYQEAMKALNECEYHRMEDLDKKNALCSAFFSKASARLELKNLQGELRTKKVLPMKEKFLAMNTVLRRLGYINKDQIIELKGRLACEINTADELVCTEMILGGVFNDLSPAHAAALLSCFVCTEFGNKEDISLPQEMTTLLNGLKEVAKRVAKLQQEAGIDIEIDEFVESFRPDLMIPVFQWCKGAKFVEICEITEVFEGSIIRCTRRLVELLRELCVACRMIGEADLEQKFAKAVELIKRDIIFAASLYL